MATTTGSWTKVYWTDLAERVGSTAIYGVITMLTASGTGTVSGDGTQWWLVVGLPTALSLLKSLGANMASTGPSASLVNVTSDSSVVSDVKQPG